MRIYYTTVNGGDGSAWVEFFESQECINLLEQEDPETYGMGEGGDWFDVDGTITGIRIKSLAQVQKELNGDFGN
jgi:hypothetical protein